MDVQKSTVTTIYKYDPCVGEEKLKAVFRDSKQAYAFLKYLRKRNRIKETKNEDVSEYVIRTERIYLI